MIPARLTPRNDVVPGTVFRAYSNGRLLAEVVTADDGDHDEVVDHLWHALEPTVAAGHKVLLAVYDSVTGLPLPAGDTLVAAS